MNLNDISKDFLLLEQKKEEGRLKRLFKEFIFATPKKNLKLFKWRNRIFLIVFLYIIFMIFFVINKIEIDEKYRKQLPPKQELEIDKYKIISENKNNNILNTIEEVEYNKEEKKTIINREEKAVIPVEELVVNKPIEDKQIIKEEINIVEEKKKVKTVLELFNENKTETNKFKEKNKTDNLKENNAKNNSTYIIQLLAVSNKENLLEFTFKLKTLNIKYKIEEKMNPNGSMYLLKVGPFKGYDLSLEKKNFIDKQLKINSFITKINN